MKREVFTGERGKMYVPSVFYQREEGVEVPEGTTLLEAERLAGLVTDAPCGGTGTCGKCQVLVNGKKIQAWKMKVRENLNVDTAVSSSSGNAVILTGGFSGPAVLKPGIAVHQIELKKTVPGDKRSDWERLL